MRFQAYLTEGTNKGERSKPITQEEATSLITTHCKKILKYYMSFGGERIYRGITHDNAPYKFIDTTGQERLSQNTSNHYTLIINNSPNWSKFPKRNIICSSAINRATSYSKAGRSGGVAYLMFPYDGQTIGMSPTGDIWDGWQHPDDYDADTVNDTLKIDLHLRDTSWADFVASCNESDDILAQTGGKIMEYGKPRNVDDVFPEWMARSFKANYKGNMLDWVTNYIYPPRHFKTISVGGKIPKSKDGYGNELWLDGKCVMVNCGAWEADGSRDMRIVQEITRLHNAL